jgi:glycosyltransferase involved in cell wall biosynthesis
VRVLHYFPRAAAGDGGISRSLRALSVSLARQGVEVTIAYDEPGRGLELDEIRWLRVPHTGPPAYRIAREIDDPVAEADILVLHSAWTAHNARAAAVARRVGTPYVLAPRGAYDPWILSRRRRLKRLWWNAFERRVANGAAAVHVFFRTQREHIRAVGYRGPLLVAPNGVRVPPDIEWDGGSGGYVLYLGRFDPEHKGLDLLVRAVAALPVAERPRIRMHGSDWRGGKARVGAMVRALGVSGLVGLHDPVYGDEKWNVLARARGLVYPSRWEAFGNSVAEAAALGVPVLTTPYPLGDYLGQRGGAIVVQPEPRRIAEGINTLLGPDSACRGRRAREIVRRDFSWPAVADAWCCQLAALVEK